MSELHPEYVVVAVYPSHVAATAALETVQRAGFDMAKWSILGKDVLSDEHAFGFYSAGNRMRFWAGDGAIWGRVWGMLSGGGFFFIPPIGPLVVMGPLVRGIVDALESARAGDKAGVPASALQRVGVPRTNVAQCELEVRAGNFLVLAQGTALVVECARATLARTAPLKLDLIIDASAELVSREA